MSKKRKAPAPDWRETLFFWRGKVSEADGDGALSWSGTWVGSDGQLPTSSQFAASPNTFTATLTGPATAATLHGASLSVSSKYLLDNGEGLQEYTDISQLLHIESRSESSGSEGVDSGGGGGSSRGGAAAAAAACGSTEFGLFISFGVLEFGTQGGSVLTLARRYLSDKDTRVTWGREGGGARAVLDKVLQTAASSREQGGRSAEATDWLLALPWRAQAGKVAKGGRE
jgi:hypothetical protein